MPTTKAIGDYYENLACQMAINRGLTIIKCNYRVARVGEIDIIAEECATNRLGKVVKTLVFIEVRARKAGQFASSAESVTPAKQRKIVRTASHFLQAHDEFSEHDCRFDVIAFERNHQGDGEWIKAAFLADELYLTY